ncbi:hypothetical protein [Brachybacterium sp. UNK5269]|uniref:hypothetical protein n=1 Tax=Brachybacterium sp. UNK5269 TaxID=3408576 RepID=UPI003BB02B82
MKVALLCDVDQTVYHVGDEAIATMSARRLRARGHEVVRISRREKYGPGGVAAPGIIPALTFPWPLEDRSRYLAEIRRVLGGDRAALPATDKLFEIIEQLRAVDAVVIGGGGSLTSRYGWLLDERLATAPVARALGKPVVLTGRASAPSSPTATAPPCASCWGCARWWACATCTACGSPGSCARTIRPWCRPSTTPSASACRRARPEPGDRDPQLLSVTLGGDGDPLPREDTSPWPVR